MLNTPFSPWPNVTQKEIQAVVGVLNSNKLNYWTGRECKLFEREFASWCNTQHAVALANGTVALDAALEVLGVKEGDEVIVTPRTFIASASCIVRSRAIPVFADVDPNSGNITASSIEHVLTSRTKAVITVHLAGWPCEMGPIMALAQQHGLYVIEDCAQAHGAQYQGRPVGSIGDIGAWSFCQDKIMTTGGEGGMLTTNSDALWSKIWSLKDHGKSWASVYEKAHPVGFRWLHESFGTNLRLTEMQAVLGRTQLRFMPEWHEKRTRNAHRIWKCARSLPGLRAPLLPSDIQHAAYKCYIYVEPEKIKEGWTRDRIIREITSRGIPCYPGSCSEIYLEKAFDGTGWRPQKRLPVAKKMGETSLMFLVHPTLSDQEIDKTCHVLSEVMRLCVNTL